MEDEEFSVLSRFLEDYPFGVEARSSGQLSAAEEEALMNLAAGQLDEASTKELLPLLQSNAHAVAFLATQIKLRRGDSSEPPSTGTPKQREEM